MNAFLRYTFFLLHTKQFQQTALAAAKKGHHFEVEHQLTIVRVENLPKDVRAIKLVTYSVKPKNCTLIILT